MKQSKLRPGDTLIWRYPDTIYLSLEANESDDYGDFNFAFEFIKFDPNTSREDDIMNQQTLEPRTITPQTTIESLDKDPSELDILDEGYLKQNLDMIITVLVWTVVGILVIAITIVLVLSCERKRMAKTIPSPKAKSNKVIDISQVSLPSEGVNVNSARSIGRASITSHRSQ